MNPVMLLASDLICILDIFEFWQSSFIYFYMIYSYIDLGFCINIDGGFLLMNKTTWIYHQSIEVDIRKNILQTVTAVHI